MTGHYTTVVLEDKNAVTADWDTNNRLSPVSEKVFTVRLLVGLSFIMTTPQVIPRDRQIFGAVRFPPEARSRPRRRAGT
ncbi:hypothetical protein EVAR_61292_1 [Eumeta japonica]|uniref:Uncharacterized protein n=1 Tax=Eumeta variegata TaxID=151549 RepID=A0A4C1XKN1_EUMVA|nr:hypothetical protein EVAR_61292_1 [Eumeta japonica]